MSNKIENTQLNDLLKYFPKSQNQSSETKQKISQDNYTENNTYFKNVFSFISGNSSYDGSFFAINLLSIQTQSYQQHNLFINLDNSIDIERFSRKEINANIHESEVKDLHIYSGIPKSKKELHILINSLRKNYNYDNIFIYGNFENQFIDSISISEYNFIVTDINTKNLVKLDKILKIIGQIKNINFGIFFTDINENEKNTLTASLEFIDNDFLKYNNNLFLVGITFKNKILDMANNRNTLPFKNNSLISEHLVYQEHFKVFNSFNNLIRENATWLRKKSKTI